MAAKRKCVKYGRAHGKKVCRKYAKKGAKKAHRAKKGGCKYGKLKSPRGRRVCKKR